jgi:hypothetical protein
MSVRRFELIDCVNEIWGKLSFDIPTEKRREDARFVLTALEKIDVKPSDFKSDSELIGDAGIELDK